MNTHVRIWLALSITLFSAVYGFLLAHNIGKAVAWGIGYICIVLTVMLLLRLWKPHDNQ